MKILFAASEAFPFVKVGGLADAVGGLARALARRGHEVVLALPAYRSVEYVRHGFWPSMDAMGVNVAPGTFWCRVHRHRSEEGLDTFLLERHDLFSRAGVYDDGGNAYSDNGQRFAFYAQAALQLCRDLRWSPDVVHCHDWPAALLPGLLKGTCSHDPYLGQAGSVMTLHNVAHQGRFGASVFWYSGLPSALWRRELFEDHGAVNFLKGGILLADIVSTVSPTYAREILGEDQSMGLRDALLSRQGDMHGILNGTDDAVWNPETDPLLPARFTDPDSDGKRACKAALQAELGLDPDPGRPLFGVVSRLDGQKGLDLVLERIGQLVARSAQLALLGKGEPDLEAAFQEAARRFPGRVGVRTGRVDERLAHLITAGSDAFLVPSRFEPCGLTQMYALRYGAVPVVRATGGLADTVEEAGPGWGTGFRFGDATAAALGDALERAMDLYYTDHGAWIDVARRGMARRFSWDGSAERYEQLYHWAHEKRRHWRQV